MDYREDPAPTQKLLTDAERRSIGLRRLLLLVLAGVLVMVGLVILALGLMELSRGHVPRAFKLLAGGLVSGVGGGIAYLQQRSRELLDQSTRSPGNHQP